MVLISSAVSSVLSAEGTGGTILNTGSYWRCCLVRGTDLVRTAEGKLVPVHPHEPTKRGYTTVNGKRKRIRILAPFSASRVWGGPPSEWRETDFDDNAWPRLKGPFLIGKYKTPQFGYRSTPLLCVRGRFRVSNPSGAGDLKLSVGYHGGIIVYVNGKEVFRRHVPEGKLKPDTPAEEYSKDVFVDAEGYVPDNKHPAKEVTDRINKRIREVKDVVIPAAMLRKGINVVALECHRSPAHEVMFTGESKKRGGYTLWSRIGLTSINLTGTTGKVAGAIGRPRGFQVWTCPIYQELGPKDYGDPCDSPGRIRLCTGRGGVVSGQVVASSSTPVSGLKPVASALQGPGIIPASAIQFRYARFGLTRHGRKRNIFLELEDFPPDAAGSAMVPVWVTVRVPSDAKAGTYKGSVTINADGQKPVGVPIELRVVNWQVPDPKEFKHSFLEFIQSPESVAMQYKVKMWSDKHWELLDRTFKLLGEVGNKVVYITAQYKTHFGNEHSMIRYIKDGDGPYDYKPDFSIAEKYLDLALKYQGKVPVVGLYIWRSPWETGNYAGAGPRGDRKILITVRDPKTGALSSAEGPAWGTPECVAFWKPVIDGMKKICADRGISGSLMLGQSGDYTPTDKALADLDAASGGLLWIHHSHVTRTKLGNMGSQPIGSRRWTRTKEGKTYPVGMIARAWGGDGKHRDPDFGRGYGWKNRLGPWRTVTREVFSDHPLPNLRLRLEAMVTNIIYHKYVGGNKDYGTHGIGRLGVDFWHVLGDRPGRKKMLCGRYSETRWGQLGIHCCGPFFLRPGRNGPIGTAQMEMFRENAQEIEARVFVEKALADPAEKEKLGSELAIRAQSFLDNRTRLAQRSAKAGKVRDCRGILMLGVQEYSEKLYALAAEVAEKLK